jgi:hypothetical protein
MTEGTDTLRSMIDSWEDFSQGFEGQWNIFGDDLYKKQDLIVRQNADPILAMTKMANMGEYIWKNQANDINALDGDNLFKDIEVLRPIRSMPMHLLKDGYESLWGSIPLKTTFNKNDVPKGAVVLDISSDTVSNFQYTNGLYSSVIPGTGDATTTMYSVTFMFSDIHKAQSQIVPMLIQFERCPIIPVWIQGLVEDGITAVAQLQCTISVMPGTPGVIVQMTVAEVDVSAYSLLQADDSKDGVNDVPFLPAITNYDLLKWYVNEFDNDRDPRYMTVNNNGEYDKSGSHRILRNIIKSARAIAKNDNAILPSAEFSLFKLSPKYIAMIRGMQSIIERVIGFITDPLPEMNEADIIGEDGIPIAGPAAFKYRLIEEIKSIAGFEDTGDGVELVYYKPQGAIDEDIENDSYLAVQPDEYYYFDSDNPDYDQIFVNKPPEYVPINAIMAIEDSINGIWKILANEDISGSLAANEIPLKELKGHFLRVCDVIVSYKSHLIDDDNIAHWFQPVFGTDGEQTMFAKKVTLTLENLFKVQSCAGSPSSLYQFIGSGGGQLHIEADDTNKNYLKIKNMFREMSKNLNIIKNHAPIPPSTAFSRIITHVTLLANKYHFVPDSLSVQTVPNMPGLNRLSMKFTMFDDNLIDRSRVHKYHGSGLAIGDNGTNTEIIDDGGLIDRPSGIGPDSGFWHAVAAPFSFAKLFGRSTSLRNPLSKASIEQSSFYDLYSHWFRTERKMYTENVYPMPLPTWGEVIGAVDKDGYPICHIKWDDILYLFNNDIVEWNKSNLSDNNEIVLGVQKELETLMLLCPVPPDFWCRQVLSDFYTKFIDNTRAQLEQELLLGEGIAGHYNGPSATANQASVDYTSTDDLVTIDTSARLAAEEDVSAILSFTETLSAKSPSYPAKERFSILDKLWDESRYSGKFSIIRSFPAIWTSFTDHTAFGYGAHLTDLSWGYGMLKQCIISRNDEDPVDQASIQLINLFGNLDDPLFSRGGLVEAFLSTGTLDYMVTKDALEGGMKDDLHTDWNQAMMKFGNRFQQYVRESIATHFGVYPTTYESYLWWERKARQMTDSLPMSTGQRVHIRIGYGQPYSLKTVFNGTISSVSHGHIVNIDAKGFGEELTKIFKVGPKNRDACEPRREISRYLNLPQSKFLEGLANQMNFSEQHRETNPGLLEDLWLRHGQPLWYPTDGLGMDIFRTRLLLEGEKRQKTNNEWAQSDPSIFSGRLFTMNELLASSKDSYEYTPDTMNAENIINVYALSVLGDPNATSFADSSIDNYLNKLDFIENLVPADQEGPETIKYYGSRA